MLEDIASASSSVHINQFGFRPGVVGDRFADGSRREGGEGVPVRLVVDRSGIRPRARLAGVLRAAHGGGCRGLRRSRNEASCAGRPARRRRATRWNLRGLGHIDHRKVVVVDGRIGWVGGAGIEDHFEDGASTTCSSGVTGPVVRAAAARLPRRLPLARRAGAGRRAGHALPRAGRRRRGIPAVVLHNAPGRYRPITDAIARVARRVRGRRSMSSTPTSPTAA